MFFFLSSGFRPPTQCAGARAAATGSRPAWRGTQRPAGTAMTARTPSRHDRQGPCLPHQLVERSLARVRDVRGLPYKSSLLFFLHTKHLQIFFLLLLLFLLSSFFFLFHSSFSFFFLLFLSFMHSFHLFFFAIATAIKAWNSDRRERTQKKIPGTAQAAAGREVSARGGHGAARRLQTRCNTCHWVWGGCLVARARGGAAAGSTDGLVYMECGGKSYGADDCRWRR